MRKRIWVRPVKAGRTFRFPSGVCGWLSYTRAGARDPEFVPLPPGSTWVAPADGTIRLVVLDWPDDENDGGRGSGAEAPAQLDTGGKIRNGA